MIKLKPYSVLFLTLGGFLLAAVTIPTADNFKAITGKGIGAEVEGKNIKVVSPGYLKENKKWGILLTPAVGAVFMSVSTMVVAINAKLLKVKS